MRNLSRPTLPWHTTVYRTDSYKYLGHVINSELKDDPEIMKQTRSLYSRANVIIHK